MTSPLNIGEEYQTSERMVNVLFVYMLNCHGQPLMPCQPRKARLLIKEGKAKVLRMAPFTLQLLYGSSGYKQEISLGVDAGAQHIGVSATTEHLVLFEAEAQPRTDIGELLASRREYRRARRCRKTGGDSPDNLVTLCKTCHSLIHRTRSEHEIERNSRSFRDATQMGIIRWHIYEQAKEVFSPVHLTYGYITKHARMAHGLEKSHLVDARCISGHPLASSDDTWYLIKLVRRNNRRLHKATIRKGGKRQRNTAPKYVHGFRLFDCVNYQGKRCFVFGRRSSGYFDLRTLDGVKISVSASSKGLTIVQKASALLVERRAAFPPVAVIGRRVSTPLYR